MSIKFLNELEFNHKRRWTFNLASGEVNLKKKKKLYEGKAKKIYSVDEPDQLIQEFKDDVPGFDDIPTGTIKGKGIINKEISSHLFGYLEGFHIPTHFLKDMGNRDMLVKRLEMIPIDVLMYNVAAGSLGKRYGIEEGKEFNSPIMEFYLKINEGPDPMLNQTHINAFGLATADEVRMIERMTFKINAVLKAFFLRRQLQLLDFKVEYGRWKNKVVLGDEVSPDTFRLWDLSPSTKPDRLRFDMKPTETFYEELKKRIL